MIKKDIFQQIEESNKPDFGDILSKSFELFKKTWEQALYHVLVSMVVVVPMLLLIYVPYFAVIFSQVSSGGSDFSDASELMTYLPLIIVYGLVVFCVIFIFQAVVFGVTAHYFTVLKKEDLELASDVGGYFDFVKRDFKKLFLLSLASFGIVLLAILLCYLPIFYVMVPIQLFGVIYAFRPELSVSDIVKASFKLGNKYWIIIFGLVLISSMVAQLGIILCFVGVLFTAYFMHVPVYYVYKDTIGFEGDTEEREQKVLK